MQIKDLIARARKLARLNTTGYDRMDYTDGVVWSPTYDSYGQPIQMRLADTSKELAPFFAAAPEMSALLTQMADELELLSNKNSELSDKNVDLSNRVDLMEEAANTLSSRWP